MLFIKKKNVEEDVQKIREYTLGGQLEEELKEEAKEEARRKEVLSEFTWKDVLAMTIAIIEILLPYFLVMIGGMVVIYFLMWWLAHR